MTQKRVELTLFIRDWLKGPEGKTYSKPMDVAILLSAEIMKRYNVSKKK